MGQNLRPAKAVGKCLLLPLMASIASTPSSNVVRANDNVQSTGWANSARIEAEIAAWYNAISLDEEKTIVGRSTGWPSIMSSVHR
jgi:hypothetical protein